jgi:hypothetical protein
MITWTWQWLKIYKKQTPRISCWLKNELPVQKHVSCFTECVPDCGRVDKDQVWNSKHLFANFFQNNDFDICNYGNVILMQTIV